MIIKDDEGKEYFFKWDEEDCSYYLTDEDGKIVKPKKSLQSISKRMEKKKTFETMLKLIAQKDFFSKVSVEEKFIGNRYQGFRFHYKEFPFKLSVEDTMYGYVYHETDEICPVCQKKNTNTKSFCEKLSFVLEEIRELLVKHPDVRFQLLH